MSRLLKTVFWSVSLGLLGLSIGKETSPVTLEFSSARINEEIEEDEGLADLIEPFRKGVEAFSREVIGHASEDLNVKRKPENGVSNLMADAIREIGSEAFDKPIDVAVSNFGGMRRNLDKGPITVGLMTELSPFENFLILVEGKGDLVLNIARRIAKRGGEPISGMELMYDRDGEVIEVSVGGEAVDPDRIYRVLTLDYLFGVDQNIWDRELITRTEMSGMRQRDAVIEYMKRLDARGVVLTNAGDGRVRRVK